MSYNFFGGGKNISVNPDSLLPVTHKTFGPISFLGGDYEDSHGNTAKRSSKHEEQLLKWAQEVMEWVHNNMDYGDTHGNRFNKDDFKKAKIILHREDIKKKYVHFDPDRIIDPAVFVTKNIKKIFDGISNKEKLLHPRITRKEVPDKKPYSNDIDFENTMYKRMADVCHNGQRKLLLTEVQHMIEYLDHKDEEAIVFYVGSAPSNKAYFLHELFPKVKFIFVDPNETRIYIGGFRDDHYNYVDKKIVSYLSCSEINMTYDRKGNKPKMMDHYKVGHIDKRGLTRRIGWKEDEMIEHITSTNYIFYVFEEFMTKEVGDSFGKLINHPKFKDKKILFWSDIRTNYKSQNVDIEDITRVSDLDVIANTAMMYVWLKHMTKDFNGFFKSMLKFRVPYLEDDKIDWKVFEDRFDEARALGEDYPEQIKKSIKEKKPILRWFAGEIYMQAFAASKSAETRLWSDLKDLKSDLIDWDIIEHEELCYYYNALERFTRKFENPHSHKKLGFDHCGDCALEASIWSDYKEKFDKNFDIHNMVYRVSGFTGRPLSRYPHGSNF